MWDRWLSSYPELRLLDLDIGSTQTEFRSPASMPWIAKTLLPYDERTLLLCLTYIADGDMGNASALATSEARKGSLLPDIHLLAGAFYLSESRFDEASRELLHCYQREDNCGENIRRIFPSLRFLVRVSPCTLAPFYPNLFGASIMYAYALWLDGEPGEALEVLREMVEKWGVFDEIRLLAGQIHLGLENPEKALKALSTTEDVKRDALELARNLYLAQAYAKFGKYRNAARGLSPSLDLAKEVNPHLQARARLMLADCFERNGLLIEALRQSAHVAPDEVPGFIAAEMLAKEERWVTELADMNGNEIERMANVDLFQMYTEDRQSKVKELHPLHTTRDPLKKMKPKEISWRKRVKEEASIADYKASVAMGKTVAQLEPQSLSENAVELKLRIGKAKLWWPTRKASLAEVRPRESLARPDAKDVSHLRFDFQGTRERPRKKLVGEKRGALVSSVLGAALLIAIVLGVLRACVY